MFESFTDRARRVVVLAQEEARMLNHNYIGTEHILLGLTHEAEGMVAKALESLGVALEVVRQQVLEIIGEGEHMPPGHIPFTPRARRVLELSRREALQFGHDYIGTEHILLGLIREGDGVAAQVLVRLGADLNQVRLQVLLILADDGSQADYGHQVQEPVDPGGLRGADSPLKIQEPQLPRGSASVERPDGGGIFLSYRREDSSHAAGRIADRLVDKFGEDRVFVDVDSIEIGADFRDAISDALARCRVLLAVIGRDWLTAVDEGGARRIEREDDLVRIEIQTALERKISVVPILVDGAGNLKERDLPLPLRALAYRNSISLRHDTFRDDLRKLSAGLEKIIPVSGQWGDGYGGLQ